MNYKDVLNMVMAKGGGSGGGGGGDFTTCTMTVSCDGVNVDALVSHTGTFGDITAAIPLEFVESGVSFDFSVILWEGKAIVFLEPDSSVNPPTLTGAIQRLSNTVYTVTGDCSVTFAAESSDT